MTGSVAARRYAKALFGLARQSGADALARTGAELEMFVGLTKESMELSRLFRDPIFSPEEKRGVITALSDRLEVGAMLRDFLFLLADKHRLSILDRIAAQFRTLLDAEEGILRGELVSALPLDAKTQDKIKGRLTKKAGKTLVLNFTVDEALLGGMVLKIGDNVMDASLKTQLSLLKDTIKRGA